MGLVATGVECVLFLVALLYFFGASLREDTDEAIAGASMGVGMCALACTLKYITGL